MCILHKILTSIDLCANNKMEELFKQINLPLENDEDVSDYYTAISEFRNIDGILLENENIKDSLYKCLQEYKFLPEQVHDNLSNIIFIITENRIYTYPMSGVMDILSGKCSISSELLDVKNYSLDFDDNNILEKVKMFPKNYAFVLFP